MHETGITKANGAQGCADCGNNGFGELTGILSRQLCFAKQQETNPQSLRQKNDRQDTGNVVFGQKATAIGQGKQPALHRKPNDAGKQGKPGKQTRFDHMIISLGRILRCIFQKTFLLSSTI